MPKEGNRLVTTLTHETSLMWEVWLLQSGIEKNTKLLVLTLKVSSLVSLGQ